MFSPDIYVSGSGDVPIDVEPPKPPAPKPAANGGNIFLKCAGGKSFYVSRGAIIRSHRLKQLLVEAEAQKVIKGEKGMLEVEVHDVRQEELVKLMEHCERAAKADGDASREKADRSLVDGLEIEDLLRVTGAAHRLGIQPILALCRPRPLHLCR